MTAGTVGPITRQRFRDDSYMVATIRHSNALVRSFCAFWIERGEGPLVNPVVQARALGPLPGILALAVSTGARSPAHRRSSATH